MGCSDSVWGRAGKCIDQSKFSLSKVSGERPPDLPSASSLRSSLASPPPPLPNKLMLRDPYSNIVHWRAWIVVWDSYETTKCFFCKFPKLFSYMVLYMRKATPDGLFEAVGLRTPSCFWQSFLVLLVLGNYDDKLVKKASQFERENQEKTTFTWIYHLTMAFSLT